MVPVLDGISAANDKRCQTIMALIEIAGDAPSHPLEVQVDDLAADTQM
jgi:hypothetical protein